MKLKSNVDVLIMTKVQHDVYEISNLVTGAKCEINHDILMLLRYCDDYKNMSEICSKFSIEKADVLELIEHLSPDFMSVSAYATNTRKGNVDRKRVKTETTFFDVPDIGDQVYELGFLGLPYDGSTLSTKGSSSSPQILRKMTSGMTTYYNNIYDECVEYRPSYLSGQLQSACDIGDVYVNHGESVNTFHDRVTAVYSDILNNQVNKIIAIGGDHSVTYPILRCFNEKIVLVHIDAHYDAICDDSGHINHANYVRYARELPHIEKIIQVGVREPKTPQINDDGLIQIRVEELRNNSFDGLLKQHLMPESNLYLSIDIDVLDPQIAPGTGCKVSFGLAKNELIEVVKSCFGYNVVGIDVVEVNPLVDNNNKTLYNVIDVIKQIITCIEGG